MRVKKEKKYGPTTWVLFYSRYIQRVPPYLYSSIPFFLLTIFEI